MTGEQLRRMLKKAELTQRWLAEALDIGERHVRRYIAGEAVIPKHIQIAIRCLLNHGDESRG